MRAIFIGNAIALYDSARQFMRWLGVMNGGPCKYDAIVNTARMQ